MLIALPNHLRPRREKIFGSAPSYPLDGNAKARLWAAASAYNAQHREGRQHQGPLTWASLRVLRVLLWRFHSADGGGRCFPSYEKIAATAKCARSTVALALAALEAAGVLTWVNRLVKVRRRERDLFGHWRSEWQVLRSSNGYRLLDPLERQPGRRIWCKSENRTGPPEPRKTQEGPRLDGAELMPEASSLAPLVPTEPPAIALRREHAAGAGALLSDAERAALTRRLDSKPTKADWALYRRDLGARISAIADQGA